MFHFVGVWGPLPFSPSRYAAKLNVYFRFWEINLITPGRTIRSSKVAWKVSLPPMAPSLSICLLVLFPFKPNIWNLGQI